MLFQPKNQEGYLLNCFSAAPDPIIELLTISFTYQKEEINLHLCTFDDPPMYLGIQYSFIPFEITNLSLTASGERSRPVLNVVNPDGRYSKYLRDGVLEGAVVEVLRVPMSMLKTDLAVYRKLVFSVYHIKGYNNQSLALELRGGTDGAKARFPARSFYPPDFGVVSL